MNDIYVLITSQNSLTKNITGEEKYLETLITKFHQY